MFHDAFPTRLPIVSHIIEKVDAVFNSLVPPGPSATFNTFTALAILFHMAFEAVVFVSGDGELSEREAAAVGRHASSDVLYVVMPSEGKAELLRDFLAPRGFRRTNIVCVRRPDSRHLVSYLAGAASPSGLAVDVTFASPYYAAHVSLLARGRSVKIEYTREDGSAEVVFKSSASPLAEDATMRRIMASLGEEPRTLAELEAATGLNYKTLARRAARLLEEGLVSKTDDYPIRYYMTQKQCFDAFLTSRPYDLELEGKHFVSAAKALRDQNKIVLDSTMPWRRPLARLSRYPAFLFLTF